MRLPATCEAVTVPEAMAALRISRNKIYDLMRTGQLRSFTIGRARRIPADEISTFMRKRMEDAA
ncbi:helix-turn-helix domain-containing protein [Streptomyces sp. 549]|uniref:helix-turn-helix domain-containing protein n=1 Tax=Streptomyces sp. 549 TaxID=3049076 RepID=UPI0024C30AF9|nr:helix-turn-helix domain-containing protein [Streptomyces sp. 549]MDK1473288.1 helix-turn-helix domain-containing protein [Streptomyces sp. 549]